jgi:signal transduction histidine kinase
MRIPGGSEMNGLRTHVHSARMSQTLAVLVAVLLVALVASIVAAARFRSSLGRERRRATDTEAMLDSEIRAEADLVEVRGLILRSMEEGVLLFDGGGRLAFANSALSEHLNGAPDDVEGLFPIELQRAVRRAGASTEPVRVEVETGSPSRWLRGTAQAVGGNGSVLLVVRDVTDARRLEAIRRDFVANASHELKTPVASIRAAAETLRHGAIEDPPAALRFTEQLEREAMRLSRIVSDLLDLSRLETGSELIERVRLDSVAADEVERLEDRAKEAGVELSRSTDPDATVMGSGRDLALLARNLVDNAIRYTPEGGRVEVRVRVDGDHAVLSVSDTGIGIPQRDLPRIFERFYRVDRARSRETGGTGLGLAIVKHVAENHGGEVTVTSELAAGSAFEVRLPVAGAARTTGP